METSRRRPLLVAAVAAVLAAGGIAAATSADAASSRTPIPGTHPAWAHGSSLATPSATSAVDARVYLAGKDPAGLAAYAAAVSTPGSADYGRYLTSAEAQQRFGTTPAQVAAVRAWLTSGGMKVTQVTQHYIAVTGSVADAKKVFAVTFGEYKAPGGTARAPEQNASAPSSVAADVLAVTGLDTARHDATPRDTLPGPPAALYIAGPTSSYYGQRIGANEPAAYGQHQDWNPGGYTPQQLRGAYGVAASRLTGKGQSIAIVDAFAAPTMLSDANTYSKAVGDRPFRPGQYRQVLPSAFDDVSACGGNGWYGEETLDVESAHAMAPDANVTYVAAPDCTDSGLLDALTTIVDNHLANIVSDSWGETEDQTTAASMAAYNQIFEQGAVEGIGFNFSSGDCGYEDPANSCGSDRDGSDKIQADFPTSSPWVTSVGGTSLAVGARNNYGYEADWGDFIDSLSSTGRSWTPAPPGTYPDSYTEGSGGGTSTVFTQPFYQRGVVSTKFSEHLPDGTTSSTPMRVEPDIAADADPSTGFKFGETVILKNGKAGFQLSRIGGTSLASPLMAGVMADVSQGLGHALGFADPFIYRLYGTGAYHDVVSDPLGPNHPMAQLRNDYTDDTTGQLPLVTTFRTTGLDGGGAALLAGIPGYDDSTGVGTPTLKFLLSGEAFR